MSVGFHFQTTVDGWPRAVASQPAGVPNKAVDRGDILREVKQNNEESVTILRHWYDHGQTFDNSPYEVLLDRARAFFQSFIDGTFVNEYSPYVDYIETWNETLANSQSQQEKQWRVDQCQAFCEVWATDYQSSFPHIKLCLANAAIGNDIPAGMAYWAYKYGHALGYHPYVAVQNNGVASNVHATLMATNQPGRPNMRAEDGSPYYVSRPPQPTMMAMAGDPVPGEWDWLSGRWTHMDQLYRSTTSPEFPNGLHVTWLFTEGGPIEMRPDGGLDPQNGWRHSSTCGGNIECYVDVMEYWAQRTAAWNEQFDDRAIGVTLFTSGRTGDIWQWFWTEQPEMDAMAALSNQYPPGGGGDPPPPTGIEVVNGDFEDDWSNGGTHKTHIIDEHGNLAITERGNIFTPPHWETYFHHYDVWAQPEIRDSRHTDPDRFHDGTKGQVLFTFARQHKAGFFQRLRNLEPGQRYKVTAHAHAWSNHQDGAHPHDPWYSEGAPYGQGYVHEYSEDLSDQLQNFVFKVGVDPTGNINPVHGTVIWGQRWHIYNLFAPLEVEFTASGSEAVLFMQSRAKEPYTHNDAYWDAITIEAVGDPPPPGDDCRGEPRTQYARLYRCLHQSVPDFAADRVFELAKAENNTVGWSFDDAGIGDLDRRTAVCHGVPEDQRQVFVDWFAEHYPGVTVEFEEVFLFKRWPTDYKHITQPFGVNFDDYKEFGLPGHDGVDIRAPMDAPIKAVADGIVADIRYDEDLGWYVLVSHIDDFATRYCHLKSLDDIPVSVGQPVSAGTVLGFSGNTGNSDGAHLHLRLERPNENMPGWPKHYVNVQPYIEDIL